MKAINLFFITLFLCVTHSYGQIEINKITVKDQDHFITTTIGYPVTGLYLYEGKTEPIVQLNANGSGTFQFEDLSKKDISWGIECSEKGIPIFKEGFNSAAYLLYYKNNDDENNEWIPVQFSIHYAKNKMYIMGERVKDYVDSIE